MDTTHLNTGTTARKLLNRQEIAEALRVHPNSITRGVKRGDIPAVHIGGRVLFDWPAVARALGIEGGDYAND